MDDLAIMFQFTRLAHQCVTDRVEVLNFIEDTEWYNGFQFSAKDAQGRFDLESEAGHYNFSSCVGQRTVRLKFNG